MSVGAILMICAAYIVIMMKKKRWWLKAHRSFGIAGAAFMIAGFIAVSLLPESQDGGLILNIHTIMGISIISLAIFAPADALLMFKLKKKWMRPAHRWAGRIAVVCACINIALGLFMAGVI